MKIAWPWKKEARSLGNADGGFSGISRSLGYINPEYASRHAVIHRCVQLISESLSLAPCRLYRQTGDNGREPASEHPLYQVLQDQFNENMTAFEGREFLAASVLINGNGYAKKVYDGSGRVVALYPMLPGAVCVERLQSGRLRYTWSRPDGRSEVLLQDEVLHIRYRTLDGYTGISPIRHVMPHTKLAMSQLDIALQQTEHSFRPPGALMIDKVLKPDQRKAIKENVGDFIGNSKSGEIIVLEAGMKFERFTTDNSEAEFLGARQLSNLDLCRIYGVPPSAAGITSDATYSNIGEESRALVVRCIAPMAKRMEQAMTASLLAPEARKTLFIEHDLSGLLRGDLSGRYGAYKTAREAGFMSVNEIRKLENMPMIPGGDEFLSPLNMTVAGARTDNTAPSGAA